MNQQHSHQTTPFSEKKHRLTLICDGVSSPANIGGLFRLCDAFGVEMLIFCNAEIDLSSPRLRKTARQTQLLVPYKETPDISNFITELKTENYHIIGLEITSESIPIQQLQLPKDSKIALVVGSEQHGISEATLTKLDQAIHVEMFGANSSMNVTQATAIALFELTKS